MRIGRHQLFMEMAHLVAKRATCFRLNVGCVIVLDRKPISMGYNGAPSGERHCTGVDCPGAQYCRRTLHAEHNAIDRLPDLHVSVSLDLYVTHSPCAGCAERIAHNPNIKRVFFGAEYRDPKPLTELSTRVELYRVTSAGHVIDWISNRIIEE